MPGSEGNGHRRAEGEAQSDPSAWCKHPKTVVSLLYFLSDSVTFCKTSIRVKSEFCWMLCNDLDITSPKDRMRNNFTAVTGRKDK